MSEAAEALSRNAEKAERDGPRLRYDYETPVLARGDGMVLVGGLGALGCGRMWVTDSADQRAKSSYAEAPYSPDVRDDFGDLGARAQRTP